MRKKRRLDEDMARWWVELQQLRVGGLLDADVCAAGIVARCCDVRWCG